MIKLIQFISAFLVLLVVFSISLSYGQSYEKDNGNTTINGKSVFAGWNFKAGEDMPKDYSQYPEYLPFLDGWDFRINLPHVRFQLAAHGDGSSATMVGVVEGQPNDGDGTLQAYGHTNNSIWMFRIAESDGQVYYKVLPSRRNLNCYETENVHSLTDGWVKIGMTGSPRFLREKPSVVVLGEGMGNATIYIVARAEDNALYFSKYHVSSNDNSSWTEAWTPLGINSSVKSALAVAFNGKLALAWRDPITEGEAIKIRIYTPSSNTWETPVEVVAFAQGRPQLVWDGTALNLFFMDSHFLLQHTFALSSNPLIFQDQVDVPSKETTTGLSTPLVTDYFHAITFNNRLHVVLGTQTNERSTLRPSYLWYTTSTTQFGTHSQWTTPSGVGFFTIAAPQIAFINDNIFVIGISPSGRVIYSRKDPNNPGNDITGEASSDKWLSPGQDIDPNIRGKFRDLETLCFNNDIYKQFNH
jgi:hypothetical protein